MEQDYIQLRDLLAEVADIRQVDEDTGQLEALLNGEDSYPVVFPVALILFGETEWRTYTGSGSQTGEGTITIKIAFDCYDDTHTGAGQDDYAASRQRLSSKVHRIIHGTRIASSDRALYRLRSRTYSLPGRIKVYEHTYSCRFSE